MTTKSIHWLQQTPLFQGLDSLALDDISRHAHEKNYKKGEQIFAIGDKAEGFFVLMEGWTKLYRISREGGEMIIHIFGPGESFAEAAVFNERPIYPANAEALSDVCLLEIPGNYFIQKIGQSPSFALKILGSIAALQHYLVQQLEQVTSRTAPQRIGTFLLKFCQKTPGAHTGDMIVNLPYDKSIISARLNIKPETFSRALAKLAPYGVTTDGTAIVITNPQALSEFCDIQLGD